MANTVELGAWSAITFSTIILWLYCSIILHKHGHKVYFAKRGLILTKSYLWMSGCIVTIVVPLLNLVYIFIQPPSSTEKNDSYIEN